MSWARRRVKLKGNLRWTAGGLSRARRTRVARVEWLEDRTLLASLQFSAGLGEQSTLDSVAQPPNYLSDVNTPASQQFNQTDGTAVSKVTLTTAASTTGMPGVNVDILSNGSVAASAPANVAVSAGLSDANGDVGPTVNVPVTIVASDSSETAGDPCNVQFSFEFNVKTFASNNATANFSYIATYTYNGTTTPLASATDQLGGQGVTPIGSGPVDIETGTLHAHIGDTFTITLSENLSGQTVAPFLGAGIDNVGWLVDANLDASIAPPDPTSTTVTTEPTYLADFGQNVTLVATVEDISGNTNPPTPTGTVQFYVDGNPYGNPVALVSGVASISDTNLPVGSHSINAAYTPDGLDFRSSSSQVPYPLVIQADATSTTVTTDPVNLADFGQNVTFAATVENISDSADPATPTGAVQVSVDGNPYGKTLALVNGVASISDTSLPVGSHSISAAYTPDDPDFAASSSQVPYPLVIQADATSTTVTTDPPSLAETGLNVTFTAAVDNISDSASPATPTGAVQFSVDGNSYGNPVALVSGVASISDASLQVGSHSISAAYTPDDPDFAASSSQVPTPLAIEAAKAATTLKAVSGSGQFDGAAVLTATLISSSTPLSDETVAFTLNEGGGITALGSATTDADGVASLTGVSLTGFTVGTFADFIGDSFAGDADYAASSASGTLTVTPQPAAQVALASSADPSLPGELITFGVNVIPLSGGPTPTGTIQFEVDGTDFGATVALSGGAATSGLDASLSVGTHTITAIYSGDGTYPAQRVTLTQIVESPSQGTGNVYTVNSLGDKGNGSGLSGDLRYAITQANANPGSVIDFSVMGTIQLTGALPAISANMTINGPGPSLLTLMGGGSSSDFSVFIIDQGVAATVSGLTIAGAYARWGAISDNGPLTLTDCTVTGNVGWDEAAGLRAANYGQTVLVTDCTISGNSDISRAGGVGGIFVNGADRMTLRDSIISGNSSNSGGGGLGLGSGDGLTVYDSLISQNSAKGGGGGINTDYGLATLSNCSLSGNSTGTSGGAISGGANLLNCTLSGNSAGGNGGALSTDGGGLTDCTFIDNSAGEGGGAIAFSGSNLMEITGCAFMGNTAAQSGGALTTSGPLSLIDSTITGNTAPKGGGVFTRAGLTTVSTGEYSTNEYVTPGALSFDGCILSGNSATDAGGGIFNIGGMTLTNSTISGNTALSGGGIADMSQDSSNTASPYPSIGTLTDCTVSGNSATSYGGGVLNQGTLTLTDSTVSGNTAKEGGGIANPILSQAHLYRYAYGPAIANSQATITGSSIVSNSATAYGGGIENQGALTLTGSTLSGNTAMKDGGGLANLSLSFFYPNGSAPSNAPAAATLADSTLYGNTSLYGGGISNEEANLTLTNDTLAANRTTGGGNYAAALGTITSSGDILLTNTLIAGNFKGASPSTAPGDIAGTIDSKSAYNLIGDGDLQKGITNGSQGNLIGSASAGTVIDPQFGPLANNGGPTETVALLAGSPAIDAGSNALAIDPSTQKPLAFDQRGPGYARIVNGTVDIGAFEYGAVLITPTQLVAAPQTPPSVLVGASFSLTVAAEDAAGNTAIGFASPVTLAIASGPAGATLGGTLTATATQGVAAFSGLTFDQLGTYTISVTGGGLSGTIGPIQVTPGTATQVAVTMEPPANVAVGSKFQLVVADEDSLGFVNPSYSGTATVALISNPGNATLGGTLTVPFVSGVATFNDLTLNATANGYLLQVTSSGVVPATTSAIDVTLPAANQLVVVTQPPSTVTAGTGFGLVVDAETSGTFDPAFQGTVTVALSNGSGATLGGTLTASAVNGVATFSGLMLTKSDSGYVLQVSTSGVPPATSSELTVTPAAASDLVMTTEPPASVRVGAPFGIAVTAEDAYGNVNTSFTGIATAALTSNPGGATLGGTLTQPFQSGVARFNNLTLNASAEGYVLQVTSSSLVPATTSAIDVTLASSDQLVIANQPPSTVTAGTGFGLVVDAETSGTLDPAFQGSVTVALSNGPGATLGGTLTALAVNGVATFSGLTLTKAGSSYMLQVSSSGVTPATSRALTVTAAAATHLVITAPPLATVNPGAGFAFRVAAEDPFGNVDLTFSRPVTVALATNPGNATLEGTLTVTSGLGIAVFSGLSLNNSGNGYELEVASSGVTPATTKAFNIAQAPTIKSWGALTKPALKFTLQYSAAMNAATAGLTTNYQVYAFSTKTVRHKTITITTAVNVNAVYNQLSNSVTLTVVGKNPFSNGGGQIKILASSPKTGVSSRSGVLLNPNDTVFTILAKGSGLMLG